SRSSRKSRGRSQAASTSSRSTPSSPRSRRTSSTSALVMAQEIWRPSSIAPGCRCDAPFLEWILRAVSTPDLYEPQRTPLYTHDELMAGYTPDDPRQSLDARIRDHVQRSGGRFPGIVEGLAQTLHDYGIERALQRLLRGEQDGRPRKVVGIMG